MKKQILIQLIMAMFAVVITNTAIGQAIHHTAPVALTCTSGPLNPIAGNPYNYGVTATPIGGDFQWWATTDQNFISAGTNNMASAQTLTTASGALLGTSASYGVTSKTTSVDITWSSATLAAAVATPTFVVAQYDATCANNLKVYKITPTNGFTVDILNLDATKTAMAYGAPFTTCVSPIQSAKYSGGTIVTDYGTNILYYEVVAANFTGSWVPTFTLPAAAAGMTITVVWDYDLGFGTPHTANNGDPAATAITNTSNGVSIFVRVTIQNGTHEGLTDYAYPLYVNGKDAANNLDVPNSDCTSAPTLTDDLATQTLLARPTVTSTTGSGFVTP